LSVNKIEKIYYKNKSKAFRSFLDQIYIHRNDELLKFFFFSILFTLRESGCSYEQQDTPSSGACLHKRMPKLAVGGCCGAAAYGIRPWMPWIWGILSFRTIRVRAV
jgi:hypothetical protein